jgi:TolB-like protein/tetratricopeptide (TPR) repeat protein
VADSCSPERRSFYAELKRRNVLRGVVLYIGAVWALAQGVAQLTPALSLPDWATRAFLIACAIGFPFWVAFAWFYEFTPRGFKRDGTIAEDAPVRHSAARKLDFAIIGVLVVAVALLATGYLVRGNAPVSRTAAFNPPADSIVVLPFTNLSHDPHQQYFSDGITEELTGALGQDTGLAVIAWETASHYAGSKHTPTEIGRALNVAHILGGSIQREGDEVRVSAELVSTVNGRELWSAHYDDNFKDIFALQDRITKSISDTLQVRFGGVRAAPTSNPQAHDLYLKGLAALSRFTETEALAAQNDFRQALKLDADYADAWVGLARSYVVLVEVSTLPVTEALPKIRAATEKALALDPRNAGALVQLGSAEFYGGHIAQARATYKKALTLDPNNAAAHNDYSLELPLDQSLAQVREAVRLNPDSALFQQNLAYDYQYLGDWPGELAAAQAEARLSPHNLVGTFLLAFTYTQLKRGNEAVRVFDSIQPESGLDKQLVDAGRLTYKSLLQPALRSNALSALNKLHGAKLSPGSGYGLLQFYLALGENLTAAQILPNFCAAAPAYCDDLAVNPIYAPLRDEPLFEKLSKQYSTITPGAAPASPRSE